MKTQSPFTMLVLLLPWLPMIVHSASLELEPVAACAALAEEGLGARGGYRENAGGGFRCNSFRKALVAGNNAQNEIRFSALGDKTLVHELRLELTVRSRGDTQRSIANSRNTPLHSPKTRSLPSCRLRSLKPCFRVSAASGPVKDSTTNCGAIPWPTGYTHCA